MATLRRFQVLVGVFGLATALAACDGADDPPPPRPDAGATDDGGVRSCVSPEQGCPCDDEGEAIECWPDALERDGVRVCMVGTRTCRSGAWSACENVRELTDANGLGVVVAAASDDPFTCSSCEPRCFRAVDTIRSADVMERGTGGLIFNPGTGGAENPGMPVTCTSGSCVSMERIGAGTSTPWNPTMANSEGVVRDPADGALVLGVLGINSPGVWVANMNDGTVSRLDPTTGAEIGRYVSARPDFVNRARPATEYCNWANTGNCPSRTAVDQNFDCYVANRAFGNQGTVTKIAANLANCVDRNGNGRIDTSTDRNGDGRISMSDATEFFGVNDECILWTVPVGVNNGVPRSVAVGVAPVGAEVGDVWVGNYNEARAYRLRPSDGAVLSSVSIWPVYPYGAAADARNRIWFYARVGGSRQILGRVNAATNTWTMAADAPYNAVGYGMAYYLSADGTQEYIFAADSDAGRVLRYDINANNWIFVDTPGRGAPRGMAADINGNVWAAAWTTGYGWGGSCNRNIWRWTTALTGQTSYTAPSASCFMGVGVTFDNAIWGIGAGNNRGARLAASRTSWTESPQVFVGPYTYSDFIGYGLNVFANPRGHYQFTTDGGASCWQQRWTAINWTATIPAGTAVSLYVRTANDTATLATRPWIGPFAGNPASLTVAPGPVPNGRYIEIDVRMETTDRRLTPRVYSVGAVGYCDGYSYDTGGTYTRVYDSTSTEDAMPAQPICDPITELPIWGQFLWSGDTPSGTSIRFEFRASNTRAGLASATPAVLNTPPSTSPLSSLSGLFTSMGLPAQLPFVEVRAILNANAGRTATPTLRNFSLEFSCMPAL
jgi:hypothetical protein